MKKYNNIVQYVFSPYKKKMSKIDWNKQMLQGALYPGKVFYNEESPMIRTNVGNCFKKLSIDDIKKINTLISVGDAVLLKDTADINLSRYINDVLIVERIDLEGRIHGKFRNTNKYINVLPDVDILVNLSRNGQEINMVKEKSKIRSKKSDDRLK